MPAPTRWLQSRSAATCVQPGQATSAWCAKWSKSSATATRRQAHAFDWWRREASVLKGYLERFSRVFRACCSSIFILQCLDDPVRKFR